MYMSHHNIQGGPIKVVNLSKGGLQETLFSKRININFLTVLATEVGQKYI